ncbi:MAG: peptidoglycan bridge formation glycyltransferase FemA/FemB family protein, partial [Firmicutes bacterium]|nr:peptidoglycan bridge formation glycyltransferase FemA/FemB family protein [Bacillota bacterium]
DFEGVQPAFVFQLDIRPAASQLLANMHAKTRYNIKLAQKKGVTIRTAIGKVDLPAFYTILQETAQRDQFLIRGYEYFEMIWDQMVENGLAQIFLAEYQGQVISATLALILGRKTWYLYGASSNDYRNVMPNYLIQWEMILWAQAQGCEIYDFRGVSGDMDESNPLYGLYRFKKGFNGELIEFVGDWDRVYSPSLYFAWTRILPRYRQWTRKISKKGHGQEEG